MNARTTGIRMVEKVTEDTNGESRQKVEVKAHEVSQLSGRKRRTLTYTTDKVFYSTTARLINKINDLHV